MTHTLYAKQEGNDRVITVSLLLGKEIAEENLLADEFGLPQVFWQCFANSFRTITDGVNGYTFDTNMTEGLVAIHRTREGLEELLNELA